MNSVKSSIKKMKRDPRLADALATARRTGSEAFHAGKMRVPAMDPAVMKLLEFSCGFDASEKTSVVIVLLDAWLAGWTVSNLAAPVDGIMGARSAAIAASNDLKETA
jgi:hypothetical protein